MQTEQRRMQKKNKKKYGKQTEIKQRQTGAIASDYICNAFRYAFVVVVALKRNTYCVSIGISLKWKMSLIENKSASEQASERYEENRMIDFNAYSHLYLL